VEHDFEAAGGITLPCDIACVQGAREVPRAFLGQPLRVAPRPLPPLGFLRQRARPLGSGLSNKRGMGWRACMPERSSNRLRAFGYNRSLVAIVPEQAHFAQTASLWRPMYPLANIQRPLGVPGGYRFIDF
jgi:hypothetical protein